DPGPLPRTYQPAYHRVGGEHPRVPHRQRQPGTEQRLRRGRGRRRCLAVGGGVHARLTTIRRLGSSPSDSLTTPSVALITSWTHLRSNAVIGSSVTGSPCSRTRSMALRATAASSLRRRAR